MDRLEIGLMVGGGLARLLRKMSIVCTLLAISLLSILAHGYSQTLRGSILFDETHNEYWESTIETGYTDLANELRNNGFVVESLKSDLITYDAISDYSVFAITAPFTPSKPLTQSEISAMTQFVSEGGGLFLAALGWSWTAYANQPVESDPANQIGREYHITVNDDTIFDPTNNEGGDPAVPLFHRFASHPITDGLSTLGGVVPSSLAISASAEPIVIGDEDSYARGAIESYPKGSMPPLAAIAESGRGRVFFVAADGLFHAAPYRPEQDNLRKYDNLRFALNAFQWLSVKPAGFTTSSNPSTQTVVSTVSVVSTMIVGENASGGGSIFLDPSLMGPLIGALAVIVLVAVALKNRTKKTEDQTRIFQ